MGLSEQHRNISLSQGPTLDHNLQSLFGRVRLRSHRFWGLGRGHLLGGIILLTTWVKYNNLR